MQEGPVKLVLQKQVFNTPENKAQIKIIIPITVIP